MKTANIAAFKKHLSAFIDMAEKGETVEVCRRNIPVAQLVGLPRRQRNHTVLGCGEGSVVFHGDLTDPLIPVDSWEMLSDDGVER